MKIHAISCCDQGNKRNNNEDNLLFNGLFLPMVHKGTDEIVVENYTMYKSDYPKLYGVFDGMGGLDEGERASYIAARDSYKFYEEKKTNIAVDNLVFFRQLCEFVNDSICRENVNCNIVSGTTAAYLLFGYKIAALCNIGDSRIYRFRDKSLDIISEEHTERRIRELIFGKENVEDKKYPLMQNFGIPQDEFIIEPYIQLIDFAEGDVYIICSDGLTDMVSDEVIKQILDDGEPLKVSANRLLKSALKNGGIDNITIILIKIE